MKRCAIFTMVMLAAAVTRAENLVITSFSGNGEVTWTYPTNGVYEYRMEWSADLAQGLWCDLESGLRGIAPTGGTMRATVPMFYRVKALSSEPTNMVYVPAGWFNMGNCMGADDGGDNEIPVHPVYVGSFYMDKYEVSSNTWTEIYNWALTNGYSFSNPGSGKGTDQPIQDINWYDCVKWANARSERDSLTPCYYTSSTTTTVYRTGEINPLPNGSVRWNADGYRLPTEAEWEKAARGGSSGYRFPWADDTISHGRATYSASDVFSYDLSSGGYNPAYTNGPIPYTSPVGSFAANGFGLYDMAGNVQEWCWDRYGGDYYETSPEVNPAGPGATLNRVVRGGGWIGSANPCRVSNRSFFWPSDKLNYVGFRLVRTASPED